MLSWVVDSRRPAFLCCIIWYQSLDMPRGMMKSNKRRYDQQYLDEKSGAAASLRRSPAWKSLCRIRPSASSESSRQHAFKAYWGQSFRDAETSPKESESNDCDLPKDGHVLVREQRPRRVHYIRLVQARSSMISFGGIMMTIMAVTYCLTDENEETTRVGATSAGGCNRYGEYGRNDLIGSGNQFNKDDEYAY